jgi:hypothetical protein
VELIFALIGDAPFSGPGVISFDSIRGRTAEKFPLDFRVRPPA